VNARAGESLFHVVSVVRAGTDEVGRFCRDCSIDVIAISEYFMVRDEVWPIEPDGGVLCVRCLEARIGRELTARDFTDCPLNRLPTSSARLDARLARAPAGGAGMTERLHPDDLDALADRIAERLATFLPALAAAASEAHGTVDVATVARELGMSRDWVYRHADELGAERRGNGPKARLRFDLERARAAFSGPAGPPPGPKTPPASRRRRERRSNGAELLPVKGSTVAETETSA
jgi:hypothetical protein